MTEQKTILTWFKNLAEVWKTLAVITGAVLTISSFIYGSIQKHNVQVIKNLVSDTISIIYKESVKTRKDLRDIYKFMDESDMRQKSTEGTVNALNSSHIRLLENNLKDKDEVIRYQKEIIENQKNDLKKK